MALRDWLRADEDFVGSADLASPRPASGDMGAISDTLSVVMDPTEIAGLAAALSVWLRTRKSDVKVHLRRGDWEVEIDATNVDDPAKFTGLASHDRPDRKRP
jgi:hypothetical protein